jgi:hypothetical protein
MFKRLPSYVGLGVLREPSFCFMARLKVRLGVLREPSFCFMARLKVLMHAG